MKATITITPLFCPERSQTSRLPGQPYRLTDIRTNATPKHNKPRQPIKAPRAPSPENLAQLLLFYMVVPGSSSSPSPCIAKTANLENKCDHLRGKKKQARCSTSTAVMSQKGLNNKQDGRRSSSSSLLGGGGGGGGGMGAGLSRSASFRANSYEASIGGVIASCRRRGGINNMLKTLGIAKVEANHRNMPHVSWFVHEDSLLFV